MLIESDSKADIIFPWMPRQSLRETQPGLSYKRCDRLQSGHLIAGWGVHHA